MPVCSYLVIPREGQADAAARTLSALSGCEVARAEGRDLLVLVTETADRAAEDALRGRIEQVEQVQALLFTFGDIGAP